MKTLPSKLKAVRLALLFQTLLVYRTPKNWEKLSSVARSEWLAQYVAKLEVAALRYLPRYLDLIDWKQSTWRFRWFDQYCGQNRATMVSQVPRPRPNPNPCRMYDDWKQYPKVRSWIDQHDHGDGASMVSDPTRSLKTLLPGLDSALGEEFRSERYRYWHDGEKELSDMVFHSEGPHSPLDLTPFPKL